MVTSNDNFDRPVNNFIKDHIQWIIVVLSLIVAGSIAWGMSQASISTIEKNVYENRYKINQLEANDRGQETSIALIENSLANHNNKLDMILDRLNERFGESDKDRKFLHDQIRDLDRNVSKLVNYNNWFTDEKNNQNSTQRENSDN
jgi:septal ring factor EnvC (AmiA/AmiB activator)